MQPTFISLCQDPFIGFYRVRRKRNNCDLREKLFIVSPLGGELSTEDEEFTGVETSTASVSAIDCERLAKPRDARHIKLIKSD
jgi:hypothetical protein